MKSRLRGYDVQRELEEQILLNLPAKSLLRFRSVCKDWNSYSTTQKFAKDHLQLQSSKSSSSLLLGWAHNEPFDLDEEEEEEEVLSLFVIGGSVASPAVEEEIHPPIPPDVHGDDCYDYICSLKRSHCNGIICLVDDLQIYSEQIVFYNPTLREHEFVETRPRDDDMFVVTWGFGHDPKTDDYKFVRLLHDSALGVSEAEVYSLRTGRWRGIELLTDWRFLGDPGTYLKGRLYWLSQDKDFLVWFDMSDESFGIVDLPQENISDVMPLLVWKGSLVRFCNAYNSFEMWVMDVETGDWSKYNRNIWTLSSIRNPIVFWKESELLMEAFNDSLMSYNLRTEKLRKVLIPELEEKSTTYASLYDATLISVKPRALANA